MTARGGTIGSTTLGFVCLFTANGLKAWTDTSPTIVLILHSLTLALFAT